MGEFEQFLLDHASDDTNRLLLGRAKWPSIDMDIAGHTIEGRRRIRTKVPQWYGIPTLHYPTRLCTEQCSSAATARYKATLAARILSQFPGTMPATRAEDHSCTRRGRIADLTGGLGVDAWAFASVAAEVLHNEMDPALSEAVRHNFKVLGLDNVTFRNACIEPDTVGAVLDGFHPDLVFMDPARRASDGHKVFRLEDCQPDILQLLPELSSLCHHLLLKISPMADISLIVKQLNSNNNPSYRSDEAKTTREEPLPDESHCSDFAVREVHVVGAEGECKELLLWLERGWTGACTLHVSEIHDAEGTASTLTFPLDAESSATPIYAQTIGLADTLLFEPGKALSKTGLFNTLSARFGLPKLSRHTHLYLLPPGDSSHVLLDFGKVFRILEVHDLSGKILKAIGKTWPQAEVTARDIPLSSDDLRRRLGVRSGGDIHIFGCRIAGNPRLLITRTIHP